MFLGVDHIVISVPDMEAGLEQYQTILGREVSRQGEPPGAGFLTAHFEFADTTVELVQPTNDSGPVARHVERGGGMYLLAMRVDDLAATLTELRGQGVQLIGDPGEGNEVTGQVFVHPRAAGGVLMQLVEASN